jgi:hypothetical protein
MFEVIKYTPEMDMKPFFRSALEQGFIFHTSPRIFHWDEPIVQNWVVYQNNTPVATFGTHSLKSKTGNINDFSIMSRMCVLKYDSPVIPTPRGFYEQHQNFVAQIVLPTCFNWLLSTQESINTYVTVDLAKPAQYMKGHKKMLQSWAKRDLMEFVNNHMWNDREVALWKFDYKKFLEQYNNCPKWNVYFPS